MKLTKLILLGLPLFLFGCPNEDDTDTDDTDDTDPATEETGETGDTDPPTPPVEFAVDIDPTAPGSFTLTITNGTEEYNWGMGQTATEAANGNGWFGEDCYLGQGTTQICHPAGMTGVTLTVVGVIDDVAAGQTTLMPADTPPLTHIVIGQTSGNCWVWGDDVTYYDNVPEGPCEVYNPPM